MVTDIQKIILGCILMILICVPTYGWGYFHGTGSYEKPITIFFMIWNILLGCLGIALVVV